MLEGQCHCGSVSWKFDLVPDGATACNCTVCRRYGALWIYDYENESVHVTGSTVSYIRGKTIEFHFVPHAAVSLTGAPNRSMRAVAAG